ncbi:MAG: hypothetical protein WCL71_07015, partial [Deltaproteobacteria bacterium]
MKHRDLIAKLDLAECVLLRHGGRHDIKHNLKNGVSQPVPRHRDVNELLAKKMAFRRFAWMERTGLLGAVRPQTPHRSPRQAFG